MTVQTDIRSERHPSKRFVVTLVSILLLGAIAIVNLAIAHKNGRSHPKTSSSSDGSPRSSDLDLAEPPPHSATRTDSVPTMREYTSVVSTADNRDPPPARVEDGHQLTAKQERESLVADLQSSGRSNEPWTRDASQLLSALVPVLDADNRTETTRVECFANGCVATIRHKSVVNADEALQALHKSTRWMQWRGIKVRSAPEPASDGAVINSYILYRPPS